MYQQHVQSPIVAPQQARLDTHDRLIDATSGLRALNKRAGGAGGEILALPSLVRLARLARSLQMPVARTVIVGDDQNDLELHVRAVPDQRGVDLVIEDITASPSRSSWLMPELDDDLSPSSKTAAWQWTCDAALVLTDVSLGADDRSSVKAGDVVGLPLTRLVRLLEDDKGDLPLLSALATMSDIRDQAAVRRDLPGVEWSLSARALLDDAGRLQGFEGSAVTVLHERVPAYPILNATVTRRLQGALRSPLDDIVSQAEMIGAQNDGPLRRDYVQYAVDIARAGRHLLAIVEDLADLEVVEDPQFVPDRETIDLADLGRRGAGLLTVRAGNTSVRIDAPALDDVLPARGDFRRTLQIVVNLIGNAVRYSPAGSMIWVRSERDDDTAVLIVADQGKGIAVEDQARIFEKFERVDPREAEGSGLGLYISRRLARVMGGDIVVDSAPGQGARFVLTLPAI